MMIMISSTHRYDSIETKKKISQPNKTKSNRYYRCEVNGVANSKKKNENNDNRLYNNNDDDDYKARKRTTTTTTTNITIWKEREKEKNAPIITITMDHNYDKHREKKKFINLCRQKKK